jgi:broad specificity phosphatase PhoE
MPTDILLVRHGQTKSNLTRLYMGRSEEDLDDAGLAQVRRLASRLAGPPINAVYSSPLQRAMATARILAEPHRLKVRSLDDLLEINFGEWQGLYLEDIRRGWPKIWEGWKKDPSQEAVPGGERFSQVAKRAVRALNTITSENPNSRVLLVSHEIIIKIMIMWSLRTSYNIYRQFVISNASLSLIQVRGNWFQVVTVNDHSHLEGLPQDSTHNL